MYVAYLTKFMWLYTFLDNNHNNAFGAYNSTIKKPSITEFCNFNNLKIKSCSLYFEIHCINQTLIIN